MSSRNTLAELEQWYSENCDGDWEHEWGVRIGTLDNPGWSVDIHLEGTVLENVAFGELKAEKSHSDWYVCRVENNVFVGHGGARNLHEILTAFTSWWRAVSSAQQV